MLTYSNVNWDKEPKPGELNQRIEIVDVVTEADEEGYPRTLKNTICRVWARVRQSGDAVTNGADAQMNASALNFAIRYRAGISVGMEVRFEGVEYKIVAVGGYDFRKRFVGMKTQRIDVIGA